MLTRSAAGAVMGREDSHQVMHVLDQFEEAWQAGRKPAIEPYLPAGSPERWPVLVGLVHVDLERRLHQGEMACVEGYLGRYPELAADAEVVLSLIELEHQERRQLEHRPLLAEYLRRFPHFGADLPGRLQEQPSPTPGPAGGSASSPLETLSLGSPAVAQAPAAFATPFSQATETPSPVDGPAGDAAAAWPAIPGYDIQAKLGEGGMGVVYKALHRRLNRPVALKMVKGDHDQPESLIRFMNEAEVVARLQHPHIVQVYEVGQHGGSPFFTMEFIEGGSLHEKMKGTPLAPREAAQVVETLARAMAVVHQQGLVHRDLKPANILLAAGTGPATVARAKEGTVGPGGREGFSLAGLTPKITDFGLVKRVEADSGLTRTHQILGTPSYMAPEQAAAQHKEIGPATDIYALGAILYELITGRPPFKGTTQLDTIQQVTSQDPVAPTRLQPKVPRDLETICLKCLEKQPARRYTSGLALAEDLARFQAGEPIMARPISVWGRGAKWARRRPAVASLLATIVVIVTGSVLALGGLYWKAEHQRRRAEHYREDALAAGDDLFQDMLDSPELKAIGAESLRTKLLERGVAFFQTLLLQVDDAGDDAQEQFRKGREHFLLANLKQELGEQDAAAQNYQSALAIFENLAKADAKEPKYARNEGAVLNNLGIVQRENGQKEQAKATFENALKIKQDLIQANPKDADYQFELAKTYGNLGDLYSDPPHRDFPQARANYQKAQDIFQQLAAAQPNKAEYRKDLATTYNDLGLIFRQQGDAKEAGKSYEMARQLRDKLRQADPKDAHYLKDLADTINNLGDLAQEAGQAKDAKRFYREAIRLRISLKDNHPRLLENLVRLSATQYNLANLLKDSHEAGKVGESLRLYEEAIPRLEEAIKIEPNNMETQITLYRARWGQVSSRALTGDFAQAVRQAEELARKPPPFPSENNSRNLACVYALASVAAEKLAQPADRKKQAEEYAAQAVQVLLKARQEGFFQEQPKVEEVKADLDLKHLTNRTDFRKLLADLEKQFAGQGK